jgi:DNA-binding LytR/AlgR family response regulator
MFQRNAEDFTKIHTIDGHIYYTTARLYEIALNTKCLGFLPLETSAVVNMKKIKAYDIKNSTVYFESTPDKNSLSTTIKRDYEKVIEAHFGFNAKEYQYLNKGASRIHFA